VPFDSANSFDLEDPISLARLDEPMTALARLRGTVVIDEVQRRPELFPLLRVLADRPGAPARFLILGSASPGLLRQSSESLAGRVEIVEMGVFSLAEVGLERASTLWLRGGFPRSFLAVDDNDSLIAPGKGPEDLLSGHRVVAPAAVDCPGQPALDHLPHLQRLSQTAHSPRRGGVDRLWLTAIDGCGIGDEHGHRRARIR